MDPAARILDANLNRAREGLRVLEDAARFALNRPDLTEAAKRLRHDVAHALDATPIDASTLLLARDTPGDVGTSITTPTERARPDLASVVSAAAGRTTEALRSCEEAAKVLGAHAAAITFERARYAAYDLDRRVRLALGARARTQWRLCVLITADLCTHMPWQRVCEHAILGGADCIQLREKPATLSDAELLARARELVTICASTPPPTGEHRAATIINDRVDIALAANADGVHLGQHDLPLRAARALAGSRLTIGVSTSALDEARRALADGADYCGIGPMFPSSTKHKDTIVGPDYLRAYLADDACANIPHLAIGGITPDRAAQLASLGCRGVAVSSVVCASPDPRGACESLRTALR